MDINQLNTRLKAAESELREYVARKLPVKAGAKAKSVFQENFRKGGFQDGARFEKWPETRRQRMGRGTDAARGPLLSSRRVLYSSIEYTPGGGRVSIFTKVRYAAIHNEGGTIRTRVTDRVRRFAWAKYYEAGGGKEKGRATGEAGFWKGLALTRKQTLNIRIPQRRFIGPSETVSDAVQSIIEKDINNILKLN